MPDDTKKPTYDAFVVDGDGRDAFWTKIGAAWTHDDGKGLNVQLCAIPLTGRITLRAPKKREKEPEEKPRSGKQK